MEQKTSRNGSPDGPAVLDPPPQSTIVTELPEAVLARRDRWGSVYLETLKGRGDLAIYQAFGTLVGGEHAHAFLESLKCSAGPGGTRVERCDVSSAVTAAWEIIESLYRTHLDNLKEDIWRRPAPFVHKRLAWELLSSCDATAFGVRRIHTRCGPNSVTLFSDALGDSFLEIADEGETVSLTAAGDHDFVRDAVERAVSIPDLNWKIDS